MSEALATAEHLSCGYHPDEPILRRITLTVAAGEIVAILGGSGSGKSTLLKTLGGRLAPLSGEFKLFGEVFYEARRKQQHQLLRRTGTLFQHDALFGSMSVLDNVQFPAKELTQLPAELTRQLAHAKLAMVDTSELAYDMPMEISGGQRKRVALARAMVLDPELLLCDEPTSGLDPITAGSIDQTLLQIRDIFGTAIIVVTHDVESIKTIADKGVVLEAGEVTAMAPIDELVRSRRTYIHDFFHRPLQQPATTAHTADQESAALHRNKAARNDTSSFEDRRA